jgi:predicted nucleic acid-binding protein
MLAVDTNVIIRYLTNDDARQSPRARTLIDKAQISVSPTVLIETDWVLRSTYGYPRQRSVAALQAFCGLPTVATDQSAIVVRAFELAAEGMDFADSLHLAAAAQHEAFVSFDDDLAKIAKRVGGLDVRRP